MAQSKQISLNSSKTQILLFRPKTKRNITKHLNFRISGTDNTDNTSQIPGPHNE